ncbi:MAG: hypothetical protein K2K57_09380 [Oscillospiraceae bacterium]|nr:hypothetical protein [Oscillospiraceae bacterium]
MVTRVCARLFKAVIGFIEAFFVARMIKEARVMLSELSDLLRFAGNIARKIEVF